MKRFAKVFWAVGVLGGLLTGVQTLTAAPSAASTLECSNCLCKWEHGMWICQNCLC